MAPGSRVFGGQEGRRSLWILSLSFERSTVTVGIDGGGIGFMFWGFLEGGGRGGVLDCVVGIFVVDGAALQS